MSIVAFLYDFYDVSTWMLDVSVRDQLWDDSKLKFLFVTRLS